MPSHLQSPTPLFYYKTIANAVAYISSMSQLLLDSFLCVNVFRVICKNDFANTYLLMIWLNALQMIR